MKAHLLRKTYKIPFSIVILAMGIGILLSSCVQKDVLHDNNPVKVSVEFDWINAPGANPEGMTVLFFPTDESSKLWRFDIDGRDGGEVELLPGIYNVLAYNNDLPGIVFTDTYNYQTYSASPKTIKDSLCTPTGMLYAAHFPDKSIYHYDRHLLKIRLTPNSLSTVYHITIDSVSGTERIKTANAMLKGLARSVCLQLESNSKADCCISGPLYLDSDLNTRLSTVTTGLGNPDITTPKIVLEIIVTTSHGKYSKTFDVTEQVLNSRDPKDVYIHISGLDIPQADTPTNPDGSPDVGIAVGVDGWQLIEIIYS